MEDECRCSRRREAMVIETMVVRNADRCPSNAPNCAEFSVVSGASQRSSHGRPASGIDLPGPKIINCTFPRDRGPCRAWPLSLPGRSKPIGRGAPEPSKFAARLRAILRIYRPLGPIRRSRGQFAWRRRNAGMSSRSSSARPFCDTLLRVEPGGPLLIRRRRRCAFELLNRPALAAGAGGRPPPASAPDVGRLRPWARGPCAGTAAGASSRGAAALRDQKPPPVDPVQQVRRPSGGSLGRCISAAGIGAAIGACWLQRGAGSIGAAAIEGPYPRPAAAPHRPHGSPPASAAPCAVARCRHRRRLRRQRMPPVRPSGLPWKRGSWLPRRRSRHAAAPPSWRPVPAPRWYARVAARPAPSSSARPRSRAGAAHAPGRASATRLRLYRARLRLRRELRCRWRPPRRGSCLRASRRRSSRR